jgi:hypothetical protein
MRERCLFWFETMYSRVKLIIFHGCLSERIVFFFLRFLERNNSKETI